VVQAHGADQVGALAAPTATAEEHYLLQKLVRAMGSANVDHRLRQTDFRDDAEAPLYPGLGRPLRAFETVDAVLLIGANPRKEAPLLNLRLRKAALKGARVGVVNAFDHPFNYPLAGNFVVSPDAMLGVCARIAVAVSMLKKLPIAADVTQIAGGAPNEQENTAAESLAGGKTSAVLLGGYAMNHPSAAVLRSLARLLAELSGASIGIIAEGNAASAWLAGAVPHREANGRAAAKTGRNALEMLLKPLKAYLLFGVEPELDALNGARARAAMEAAEFVVMLTTFKPSAHHSGAVGYADVWLPLAPFTEMAGTFVNGEGRAQTFNAVTEPKGLARPGWKILRVLGTELGLDGFDYIDIAGVRHDLGLPAQVTLPAAAHVSVRKANDGGSTVNGQLLRVAEVPMYRVDALVRRSPALQKTADNPAPAALVHPDQAARLGLQEGSAVRAVMQDGEAQLGLHLDERVPLGCVWIPAGYVETAGLGGHGLVTIVKEGA
ncbi:MAG TPA: molybdopterin-dependent oxidoreductase, partial [Burkholderiales bacterium]|nr:molybdopterin-dependent oxidoreductase [Burkholderiales bacterium]